MVNESEEPESPKKAAGPNTPDGSGASGHSFGKRKKSNVKCQRSLTYWMRRMDHGEWVMEDGWHGFKVT
jgi:hypothetical protein